jgi:hypothetical protein
MTSWVLDSDNLSPNHGHETRRIRAQEIHSGRSTCYVCKIMTHFALDFPRFTLCIRHRPYNHQHSDMSGIKSTRKGTGMLGSSVRKQENVPVNASKSMSLTSVGAAFLRTPQDMGFFCALPADPHKTEIECRRIMPTTS